MGNRLTARHPEWLSWQVIQNSNAYEEGFTAAWDAVGHALWAERSPATEAPLRGFLELDGIRSVYLIGAEDPEQISPDNWTVDRARLERPGARQAQLDLFHDYRTNVALYPQWQTFLREREPPTSILWADGDAFFTPEGAGPTCATSRTQSSTRSQRPLPRRGPPRGDGRAHRLLPRRAHRHVPVDRPIHRHPRS